MCSIGLYFAFSFTFLFSVYRDGSMLVKNNSRLKIQKMEYKRVKFFIQALKKIDYLAVVTVIIVLNGF
jgi:hypothetical protein